MVKMLGDITMGNLQPSPKRDHIESPMDAVHRLNYSGPIKENWLKI
jgi:hypothetical protein